MALIVLIFLCLSPHSKAQNCRLTQDTVIYAWVISGTLSGFVFELEKTDFNRTTKSEFLCSVYRNLNYLHHLSDPLLIYVPAWHEQKFRKCLELDETKNITERQVKSWLTKRKRLKIHLDDGKKVVVWVSKMSGKFILYDFEIEVALLPYVSNYYKDCIEMKYSAVAHSELKFLQFTKQEKSFLKTLRK